MHIWCEYEEIQLKTQVSQYKKPTFGSLVATIGIAEHQKSVGIMTLVQGTYDLNLRKK